MDQKIKELLIKYQELATKKLRVERKYEEAAEYAIRGIQCAELLDDWQIVIDLRILLGHAYGKSAQNEYAAEVYCNALKILEDRTENIANWQELYSFCKFALCRAWRKMGKLNQVIPILEEVGENFQDPSQRINILNDLGLAYWQKASITKETLYLDQAVITYQKAIELADEIDAPRQKAMVLNNKGMVYYEKNQYDDAIEAFYEALSITNDEYYIACISNEIAKTYLKLGNFHKAKKFINKANQILIDYDENLGEIELLRNLAIEGLYQRKIGNFEDAVHYFDMAATKLEDQELKIEAAETFHQLSLMLKERGDIRSGRYAVKFEELAKDIEEQEQRLVSN